MNGRLPPARPDGGPAIRHVTSRGLGLALVCGLVLGGAGSARAADLFGDPSDFRDQLALLQPGDRLILMPGTYEGCLSIDGLYGTAAAPIVITGPESGPTARFVPTGCMNPAPFASTLIRIQDSRYLELRHLELDGQGMGINGIQGGYDVVPNHHITIAFVHVHDNDLNSQFSGISSFSTAWNWHIHHNRLERNGLGMYLGNSDGADPFIAGVVEHNLFLDPKGYCAQIKHQFPRIAVQGMPRGDSVTTVRHNVFIKSQNGVQGDAARPNLLIGDVPPSGVGANDRYEVYGNFFFQNDSGGEPLFQGEGNLAFHDNVMVNGFAGFGVWIRAHNGVPRNIDIYHNTVVTRGPGVMISDGDARYVQRAVGNAIFADMAPLTGGMQSGNETGDLAAAAAALTNPSPMLGVLDLYPRPGMLQGAALDLSAFAAHADVDRDFNGRMRTGTWRGAYAGDGTNPGWMLAAAAKPDLGGGPMPGPDAGVADSGPRLDAGFVDAGGPSPDGGSPAVDAGAPIPDGGAPPPADGGVSEPPRDGGVAADAAAGGGGGADGGRRNTEGGCGCGVAGSAPGPAWGGLLVLALGLGRRRRTSVR